MKSQPPPPPRLLIAVLVLLASSAASAWADDVIITAARDGCPPSCSTFFCGAPTPTDICANVLPNGPTPRGMLYNWSANATWEVQPTLATTGLYKVYVAKGRGVWSSTDIVVNITAVSGCTLLDTNGAAQTSIPTPYFQRQFSNNWYAVATIENTVTNPRIRFSYASGSFFWYVDVVRFELQDLCDGIVRQPADTAVVIGSNAVFTTDEFVGAYQWQFNGTSIAGATSKTHTVTNAQLSDAGSYSVIVTNASCSVTSQCAILQVRPLGAPSIHINNRLAVGTVPSVAPAQLTISDGFTNGFIFYTLDGSVPTTSSPLYTGPITLTNPATIQAMSLSADFSQTAYAPAVTLRIIPAYNLQTAVVGGGTIGVNPPNGPYASNTVVILTANAAANWFFGHWGGDATGSENPLTLTMNGPRSVQAVFFNLQTSVVGGGTISVNWTNPPPGSNTVVVLTANAAANWTFDHWAGDVTGSQNPASVVMDGPRSVQAVFVQTHYPLTATTPGGGAVTVNGQLIPPATFFPVGSLVTLSAVASNGWSFLGWQGDASGTNNPLSLTISQTNNIQAIFGTVVSTNAVGGGRIVLSQPNPVAYGTQLTVSAVPDAGNYFVTWSGAASGTNTPTTIAVTSATPTVSALFSALPGGKYSLAVVVMGRGSVTISPQRSYYDPGTSVTLTASTTNALTSFFGWTGDVSGTNNPLVVVVNANTVVQANFGSLPKVSISPQNVVVFAGSNAVLSAHAAALPPLSYQWLKGSGPIFGATNSTYVITNAQPVDAGSYTVVVSNPYGSATSGVATVTVVYPPSITVSPQSQNAAAGTSVTLGVLATGTAPLSYQWRNSLGPIAGATGASYVLNPVQTNHSENYSVVVSNPYGAATSAVATLFVYVPVSIIVQPAHQVVRAGAMASFSVVAGGYPAPSYQWALNGSGLLGATSSVFTITNVMLSDLGDYTVLVGNGYSSRLSDTATLSMSPSITAPFSGATAIWGRSATLSVAAIGTGELWYQWFKDGVTILSGTNQTYELPVVGLEDGGYYSVVVSSLLGSVTNSAQVVVNPAGTDLGMFAGITITGAIGYSYEIQYSTNLTFTNSWVTLTNLTLQQPVELWVDTSVDAIKRSHRYYRLLPVQ